MNKLKALLYKLGYPLAKIIWFFTRPTTAGVRCIITHDNKILLVSHTYGSPKLTTVGGGIEKSESPEHAVRREVFEEVGLTLMNLTKVGSVLYTKEYKHDTIHVFLAQAKSDELNIDHSEIKTAEWYDINNLPKDISPLFYEFYKMSKLS